MRAQLLRRSAPVAVAAASLLVLSACGSATPVSKVRDTSTDVPFTGCDQVACEDTIDGAPYEIRLPDKWNGTLLIYSHGYRYAQPAPPDFRPVSTEPQAASDDVTAKALLDQGYALAGSAYASNGWAVADGVKAAEDLYAFFKDNVGDPNRVLVWGDSLGGLITQTIAEKHPEWVDGAAPLCGAVAGVVPNMDLALDVSYAVKTLIYPDLKLTGYASYEESVQNFTEAAKAVLDAASDTSGGGTAKVLTIAALVDAPGQTQRFDGAAIESKVKATVESLVTALGYATFARYDLEERFGGNPSSNEDTDYAERVSESEASLIDTVTPGAAAANVALLQAGQRVPVDAAALDKALAEGGDPQGTIQDPTITLHTASDPLVIVQNETFLRDRYLAAQAEGRTAGGLVQLYTVAPATYPETPGAPYGAGHCNFTLQSRVAVIDLLTDWVQNGVYPGTKAIAEAMGTSSGLAPLFVPGPWPDPDVEAAG
ncbi:MAG: alpha/beta hydrolase [Actinobacteria bacterium]|nr:alpha/beta hydrolase [Actinomycetota bacterium]